MRQMIEAGLIGKVQKLDAQYYQGWINLSSTMKKNARQLGLDLQNQVSAVVFVILAHTPSNA